MGGDISWAFFLPVKERRAAPGKEAVQFAAQLHISLSADELNVSEYPDQEKLIERVKNDVGKLYGKRGQALFAVGYYGESAELQLNLAHSLEYKDVARMKDEIVLSADFFDKVVEAAGLLSIDNKIISASEATANTIRELSKVDVPQKDAIYAAFGEVVEWNIAINNALKPIAN